MARTPNDPYANLDAVEYALSLALLIPRTPTGRVVDTKGLELDPETVKQTREALEAAQEELGPDFLELRDFFRDESGTFRGMLGTIMPPRNEIEGMREYFTLNLDTWGSTVHHAMQQRRLIDLLISLRHAIVEALRIMPHEYGSPPPARMRWGTMANGHVVFTFGGFAREIAEERLAWMFAEVAGAGGNEITWEELITRRLHYRVSVLHIEEVETVSNESMARYGREIRKQLHPFGDLWEQDSKGARWHGTTARAS